MPAKQSRKGSAKPALPPFDPILRYTVEESAAYLRKSRATVFVDIREGRIAVIRERKRVYIPGSEIARLCASSAGAA